MRNFLCLLFLFCISPLLAHASLSLKDVDGKSLSLKAPAQRIISLAPHITDMLLALNAGPQIVAVSDDRDKHDSHARRRHEFPVVGDAAALNYERILALRPDLIIVWGGGTPRAWIEQLRQLGLPVFAMEAQELADIGLQLEQLGRLTGHEVLARQQQVAYLTRLTTLRTRHATVSRLRFFYQVWTQPLYSLGRHHLLSQALALCGADNIVPAGTIMAPLINPEFVLTQDPDMILFSTTGAADSRVYWSRFGRLQAVQKRQLLAVDDFHLTRPGPDMLVAVERVCHQMDAWREGTGKKTRP